MTIRSIRQLKNLRGKKIFLRVDFNVPIKNGKIREDYKIKSALSTINYLQERGASLIIATHLGDPAGRYEEAYSVKPVVRRLRSLLQKPVKFLSQTIGPQTTAAIAKMAPGDMVMLENLRFNQGEYDNDPKFARALADLADIYVNDAFAVCHRNQASVAAIKKYLPAYAGRLLEGEVLALHKILKPKKPLVVVMGGAKIATKAPLISQLHPAAERILIGGALANNFFKYQGWTVGRSLVDSGSAALLKKFFVRKKLDPKIILPPDVVVRDRKGHARVVASDQVKATDNILDIGPRTIATFAAYIKSAATLVWNGPLGQFEEPNFKHGTLSIATLIAARSSGRAYGVVGGGETIEALKLTKMEEYVDWVSTAGGAMLTYLGGEAMPGLQGIVKK
jgi:phosphoglycerate kinase